MDKIKAQRKAHNEMNPTRDYIESIINSYEKRNPNCRIVDIKIHRDNGKASIEVIREET